MMKTQTHGEDMMKTQAHYEDMMKTQAHGEDMMKTQAHGVGVVIGGRELGMKGHKDESSLWSEQVPQGPQRQPLERAAASESWNSLEALMASFDRSHVITASSGDCTQPQTSFVQFPFPDSAHCIDCFCDIWKKYSWGEVIQPLNQFDKRNLIEELKRKKNFIKHKSEDQKCSDDIINDSPVSG
ncbi:hypothetical protein JOQ06_028321 [Pogonophryne albipinna]|uniref:Uncharacterized protein n=1 Tax=Pogonophryne albipinna TaxID=1090488 RepID=A0AAD6B699_9TELE|nr:hypothetical protein JOQ06_028321 [Pogonophryne albipinna]